jgi:hypothetical protein
MKNGQKVALFYRKDNGLEAMKRGECRKLNVTRMSKKG